MKLTTEALEDFREQEFCLLKKVIPPSNCREIRESVIATVRGERNKYNNAPEYVGFVPGLISVDQSFAKYLADGRIASLCHKLLGEHFRISFTSAIINEPGNARGGWHADWPFNQKNAGHLETPYPDAVMHITTLWILSPFTESNGGTLLRPGSHSDPSNPTAPGRDDAGQMFDDEIHVTGSEGSVIFMDSRLWHAAPANRSSQPRVVLAVRHAPWWLNLEVLRPGSDQRRQMCDEAGKSDNIVPPIPREIFDALPRDVRSLFRHWVEVGNLS
jgi:hypothetical protein